MPGKEIGFIGVFFGLIMSIISIIIIVFLGINEGGMLAIYLIVVVTLILDIILIIGFFILILAATRGT